MENRYKSLVQERADLVAEQKKLFEAAAGRALTDEEKGRDDAIAARLEVVADDLRREERRREFERTVTPLVMDEATSITGVPDDRHPFKSLGEQMSAVIRAKLAPHDADPRLDRYNRMMAATGMHEGGLAEGGAFVQTEFSNTLIERVYETGRVLSRVPEQPIGANMNAYSALLIKESSRVTGSRYGGLRVYRVGEGGTINASRPEFDRKEIRPYKMAALCYLTDELVQDATALEGHVRRLFPLEAAYCMENELFNGTGVGQSMGVLNAGATLGVDKEVGQAAKTITYKNLLDMWASLWTGSEGNAVWYANKDTFPQLMQVYQAAGAGALRAEGVTFAGGQFQIFGAPVVFVEYCATLGTVGDICLVDFSQYLGVSKGQMRSDSSLCLAFTTDEMALRFVWRYTAEPLWSTYLTPASGSTNYLSPYVTLDTRA